MQKCILPEPASLSPLPLQHFFHLQEWNQSVSSDSSLSWQTSKSFPFHTLTRLECLHTHLFVLPTEKKTLQEYCPQENSFTCDLVPGVIGTLKLFKSQMKISESLAPEAKRLLCRKIKRKSSAEIPAYRFLKNKWKQKPKNLPKWGESCIS